MNRVIVIVAACRSSILGRLLARAGDIAADDSTQAAATPSSRATKFSTL